MKQAAQFNYTLNELKELSQRFGRFMFAQNANERKCCYLLLMFFV